jgi:hypothetical protein
MQWPSAIIAGAQVVATFSLPLSHALSPLHWPASGNGGDLTLPSLCGAQIAAIFPMASEAVRKGRVRASLKEATRSLKRARERLEREAHARRLFSEPRTTVRLSPQSPEERERRRRASREARDAETARLNAEFPAVAIARQCLHDLRYHAETVSRRDDEVFWPTDAWCRGRELPALNADGDVPGMDATGRVLALIGDSPSIDRRSSERPMRLIYVRLTRLLASLALGSMLALRDDAKEHPPADHLAIVREARVLFWDLMRAMRALDAEWGL